MSSLPWSTPEAQGLATAALDSFVAALDASDQEIQTLMLLRHGQVVLAEEWAPYRRADRHMLFSVSKSFTSMAIGLLVEAGQLSLDDQVISFFDADDLPATVSDNLAAMRIRHLLTMTTGHSQDTVERLSRDRRMVRIFLGLEVEEEPGTLFVYNSGATYMLSAILQKVTGERLLDYLRPRLFEPLGATEAIWDVSREGINTGGWGLSLSTESLAKFGQLLLQRGEWEGRQLLPAEWIDAATSRQVPNDNEDKVDWRQGYGFQFWRARHNTYRGDGAFGQYCVVFPEQDASLIITSASPDMQATLDIVWEHLLPAFEGATGDGTKRPPRLEIVPPKGAVPTGNGRTYRFEPNQAMLKAVRLDADGTGTFTFAVEGQGEQDVVCAPGDWRELTDELTDPPARLVTSAYADGDAFVATFRYLETPFVVTMTCRTDGEAMTIEGLNNVGFGPARFTLRSR
ncbi:CubicO group peptidase (beta-lactamase class C family) [Kribbella voronezhensis]|uniref:CubicO group peptidase (Beta-lactamase class C family) n=1 Tax=Kribbella voronezhensis TaxID=2512212 RepID=A0A4R7T728_9ACTN|nr:serine hydrolase [Kribbella voronezhensis]TDU87076.1 CubicO group peptidase (beta-lactamase class C family) [Kribbella voronezhensis]